MTDEERVRVLWESSLPPRNAIEELGHLRAAQQAERALLLRLTRGELEGIAKSAWVGSTRHEYYRVPTNWWRNVGLSGDFWDSGDTEFGVPSDKVRHQNMVVSLFGVRFPPEQVHELLSGTPTSRLTLREIAESVISTQNEPKPKQHPRGRTPNAWWADAWLEIACQLFTGDLQPDKQADIENALLQWASDNGHEMSERTARTAAQKLWNAEGKKGQ
jgi:hypothetical protein